MKEKKKLILALAIIFALNIAIIIGAQLFAGAASYKLGSSGDTVKKIQQRLANWGYYSGSIDGVYGSKTEAAVRKFQKANGLTADGVAGPVTLAAIGLPAGSSGGGSSGGSGSTDVNLLARLISAEARGEPYSGQVAVGAVVLNRIEHPSFPSTLSGVIYQRGAFTCVTDGQFDQPVAASAYKAARDALNGWDPSGGAIYYFNPSTATSKWIWSRPYITTIGKHRFCA